jgi:hypothetical protein
MRRSVTVPKEDMNCNDKRLNYKSMADYERFLKGQLQGYVDAIGGYNGGRIDELKNSNKPEENALYFSALENLQLAETTLNSYIQCINKDIIQRNDYTSRLYTLQKEIEGVRKEAEDKKLIAKEAKERSNQLQDPYNNTTWWETWFPLGRPLRKESVPVLLSVSILMLVFSLGIFLRYAGMELKFESIQNSANSLLSKVNSSKYPRRV